MINIIQIDSLVSRKTLTVSLFLVANTNGANVGQCEIEIFVSSSFEWAYKDTCSFSLTNTRCQTRHPLPQHLLLHPLLLLLYLNQDKQLMILTVSTIVSNHTIWMILNTSYPNKYTHYSFVINILFKLIYWYTFTITVHCGVNLGSQNLPPPSPFVTAKTTRDAAAKRPAKTATMMSKNQRYLQEELHTCKWLIMIM